MKFSSGTLLALASSLTLIEATPVLTERNTTLVPILVEETSGNGYIGKLEFFDDTSLPILETTGKGDLNKRCGSNQVTCDHYFNLAQTGICGKLLDDLGKPENKDLSITHLTSVCFTANNISGNNVCCIAWPERVSGHRNWMLFNGAGDAIRRCDRNGYISAVTKDVNFGGWCTRQCMSNRNVC